jgi:hypothetical protein
MATKPCKQCGELKPVEQFRKYYGGRKGTYNTCKMCEKINSREKYLVGKLNESTITGTEIEELNKIYKLWEYQAGLGLRPPRRTAEKVPLAESLDTMIERYEIASKQVAIIKADAPVQPELAKWLIEPLTQEPEYYLDEVYEQLKEKYRPQHSIDSKTMLPVYDDTYKEVLDKILDRFYTYEDTYYEGDE